MLATAATAAWSAAALAAAPGAHATEVPVAGTVHDLFVGNVDNGGGPDALVGHGGTTASLLAGGLAGAFAPFASITTGQSTGQTVAEATGDAQPDIVSVHGYFGGPLAGMGKLSVTPGTGGGAFAAPIDSPLPGAAMEVATADLNGDARADAAVGFPVSGEVGVLLGNGNGTFGAPALVAVGGNPFKIAAADVDEDGDPDLVAFTDAGTAAILTNDGAGGFTAGGTAGLGGSAEDGAVADVNGDGHLDLVSPRYADSAIAVVLGDGHGAFSAPTTFSTGGNASAITVADVDGDGAQDALAGRSDGGFVLLRGAGDGTFAAPLRFAVPSGSTSEIATADLDGDGGLDVLTGSGSFPRVDVLLGRASGRLAATSLVYGSAAAPVRQGTLSAPQQVTVQNAGLAPITVAGFAFGGDHPDDFLSTGDTCRGTIPVGGSCTITVRFTPRALGTRTATIEVFSTDIAEQLSATLTGTGGLLNPVGPDGADGATGDDGPKGQTGAQGTAGAAGQDGAAGAKGANGAAGAPGDTGAAGPQGATGVAGPKGKDGQVHLITCTTRTVKGKKRQRCTTKVLATATRFTRTSRATLTRHGRTYATGTATRAKGLRLTATRAVPAGRYTLTLRTAAGARTTTTITIR